VNIIGSILTLQNNIFAMTTTQNSTNTTYLILGGARSGKSSYAEKIAKQSDLDVIYIATATVFDDEMKSRVQHHVNDRPSHWETIEEPIELAKVLSKYSAANNIVLVDCLTMWVNNLLMQDDENVVASEVNKLLDTVEQLCQWANCLESLSMNLVVYIKN